MIEPFVLALATLSLVDSISFMIVTPSLAFYITSLGGSQDFYGFVLAIYSFSSFCGKPVLGRWSDAFNFQVPYMVSISLSVLGGLLYAIAPAFSNNKTALASVALGRIVGGFGRANSALAFAYVARKCEAKQRTSIMTLLGGVQMIGMAIAPLFNAFLSGVDFSLLGVHFDNLNSVGGLLVIINLISQVVVYLYLPNLPMAKDNGSNHEEVKEDEESEWLRMFRHILTNPHIGVPFLTIFVFNFNWQFVETALAPAGADILQWGPVEVSYVLGVMAVLVFIGMTSVHKFSQSGVTDFKLLCWGLFGNTIGYLMLYLLWYRGVPWFAFITPVFVGAGTFPFLGAPNRSLFSEACDNVPQLSGFEGTMQALLSMASSVGGFTAPSMITHYCLRTPDEVTLSTDGREFTPLALFSPVLSLAVLVATFVSGEPKEKGEEIKSGDEESFPDETTQLLAEKNGQRRRSDGDAPERGDKIEQPPRPHRRRSMMSEARCASIRGSMLSPMTFVPPDDMIYDDYDSLDARLHRQVVQPKSPDDDVT